MDDSSSIAQIKVRARPILDGHPGLSYALLFGSCARGEARPGSDIDIAVAGNLDPMQVLGLERDLELALGRRVQVVAMTDAPLALRFRIFRDGLLLAEIPHSGRVIEQARTVVEYLDFRPTELRCAQGVLRAAARGGPR